MSTSYSPASTDQTERIQRARQGDQSAIRELYERYQAGIFRYLYYQVGDPQAAEDLAADVFVRMIQSLPAYRLNGSFQGWLYMIARNLSVDHHRRQAARPSVRLEEELAAAEDDPAGTVESRLTVERLRGALRKLNVAQREVLSMRFVSRLPLADVAVALNKSEDAVKGLQRRALMALRQSLQDLEVPND